MTITHFAATQFCQKREFGPLRLLKWVENRDLVTVKDNSDFMPGATFQTAEEVRRSLMSMKRFMSACSLQRRFLR